MVLFHPQFGLKPLQINKKRRVQFVLNRTANWCDNLIFVLENITHYMFSLPFLSISQVEQQLVLYRYTLNRAYKKIRLLSFFRSSRRIFFFRKIFW